ncbi:MAG: hypothetical protein ACE5NC_00490 [Anaerolineae bacterium]
MRAYEFSAPIYPLEQRSGWISRALRSRGVRLILVGAALASLVGFFYLSQASQSTSTVIRLHQLAAERERLRRENAQLEADIARAGGIANLTDRARRAGFAESENRIYLSTEPAPEVGEAAGTAAERRLPPSPPLTWPGWLISQLRILLRGESVA